MADDQIPDSITLSQEEAERLRLVLAFIIEDPAVRRLLPEDIDENATQMSIRLGRG